MARLVFDLDGTLVHSLPTMTRAANALLAELDRPPVPEPLVAGFVGQGMRRLVARLLAHAALSEAGLDDALARYRAHYEADPVAGTEPYAGVPAALAALAAAGHGLAVCTQKPERPARAIVESLGLAPPIAIVAGGDSLPGVLKPDRRLFDHAADRLPPGPAIMIGDSATDAATARAAGAPFLLHLAGYDAAAPDRHGADAAFADWAEVPGLVAALLAR